MAKRRKKIQPPVVRDSEAPPQKVMAQQNKALLEQNNFLLQERDRLTKALQFANAKAEMFQKTAKRFGQLLNHEIELVNADERMTLGEHGQVKQTREFSGTVVMSVASEDGKRLLEEMAASQEN